jgi:hypothetical protein
MNNRAQQIYKPEFRFGLGGVSLGNEFNKLTDKDAEATLEAAWAMGVQYFDVAPWYGFGLSERRFGHLCGIHRTISFSTIRPMAGAARLKPRRPSRNAKPKLYPNRSGFPKGIEAARSAAKQIASRAAPVTA